MWSVKTVPNFGDAVSATRSSTGNGLVERCTLNCDTSSSSERVWEVSVVLMESAFHLMTGAPPLRRRCTHIGLIIGAEPSRGHCPAGQSG